MMPNKPLTANGQRLRAETNEKYSDLDRQYIISIAEKSAAKQDWQQDRAFIRALGRGKEKGFPTMDDFIQKRDKTQLYYATRKQSRKVGERTTRKYAVLGGIQRGMPALWITAGLIWFAWGLHTGMFFPQSGIHAFRMVEPTPTAVIAPTPAPVPVNVAMSDNPADFGKVVTTGNVGGLTSRLDGALQTLKLLSILTGVGFLSFLILTRFRKKPDPVPSVITVLHQHAPE